ncbi:hypothetical protein GCM10010228_70440 [Streptomyces massasporeus]|nr:hypothetical protein GCM10010228_70440 [Streptomyces massasporeus]
MILLGAPMYDYAIPSTFKAWIDHVFAVGRTSMTEHPSLAGKPAIVVTSRGGSYQEGAPQHGNDHVQSYLRQALGTGLGPDVTFIVPELTLAPTVPAMPISYPSSRRAAPIPSRPPNPTAGSCPCVPLPSL